MSPSADSVRGAPLRLMQVVGARPQFVKLAPVCRAIAAANADGAAIENFVVHTGQHYDPAMSDVFFSELGIPAGGPRPRRRLRHRTAARPRACWKRSRPRCSSAGRTSC